MNIKKSISYIQACKHVFGYVTLNEHDGDYFEIKKADALAQLKYWLKQWGDIEIKLSIKQDPVTSDINCYIN